MIFGRMRNNRFRRGCDPAMMAPRSDRKAAMTTFALTLTVRSMRVDDIPGLAWSGSPLHLRQTAEHLDRSTPETMDFLVVVTATDISVGKGEINYETFPGAGSIGSVAVRAELQSLGIGTFLISAAERRIRDRGLSRAELDVEENNPRARALYERLGYVAYDRKPDSWDQQGPDGIAYRYETICTMMRKQLESI